MERLSELAQDWADFLSQAQARFIPIPLLFKNVIIGIKDDLVIGSKKNFIERLLYV